MVVRANFCTSKQNQKCKTRLLCRGQIGQVIKYYLLDMIQMEVYRVCLHKVIAS